MAGIDELQVFGHFATYVALSRKQGQPYEYFAYKAADEVYMTLLYDMKVSEYEKRYQEIMKAVNKT